MVRDHHFQGAIVESCEDAGERGARAATVLLYAGFRIQACARLRTSGSK